MRKGADPSTRNLENEQPVHLVPDGPVGEQVRAIGGVEMPLGPLVWNIKREEVVQGKGQLADALQEGCSDMECLKLRLM